MKLTIEADFNTCIQTKLQHRGINCLIHNANFNDTPSQYDTAQSWCTYVFLTIDQFEKVKSCINDAPWNCGKTYFKKITEEHIDCPPELKEKWNRPYYKIGDDFQHLWDMDRQDMYDLDYMKRHIKRVADFFADILEKDAKQCQP